MYSIIVPLYNASDYIERCVNSILSQDSDIFIEIIIVDDGSTDVSLEIIQKAYCGNDKVKIVVHGKNKGLVNARKTGIRHAKGKYVIFVDADDYLQGSFLTNCNVALDKNDVDLVCFGFCEILEDGGALKQYNGLPDGRYTLAEIEKNFGSLTYNDDRSSFMLFTFLWNKIFLREKLLKICDSIDERITIGEDAAFLYHYLTECNSIYISSCTDYCYVQHPNSMVKMQKSNTSANLDFLASCIGDLFLDNTQLKRSVALYIDSLRLVRMIQPKKFFLNEYTYIKRLLDSHLSIGIVGTSTWAYHLATHDNCILLKHTDEISTSKLYAYLVPIFNSIEESKMKEKLNDMSIPDNQIITPFR